MKKTVVLCSALVLLLSACQNIFTPTVAPGPTIDSAATADSLFRTAVAQTLTAQPSPTAVVAVDTPTLPADLLTPSPTEIVPATPTSTPDSVSTFTATPPLAELSATLPTATFNVPTATIGTADPATTGTATLAVGQVTPVWTLAVRLYGTLPPAVPFGQITLVNRANTEAYISLQVTMPDGKYSILEYPVEGSRQIQAPVGQYRYVTWVGGRKMVGEFRLHKDEDLSITLFRNRVEIK
ncbi:MAG TPA: hypothetical protein VK900_03055 [Anaerolineales bacterium]|nr:hypothetical protein [Anaerolineales bacterium]